MIANIRNIDGYVSGEALLPFFNNTVEIELDSDSQEDLEGNPLHILRFARLLNIHFDRLLDHGEEVMAANLEFYCDWKPEHGMVWSIINPILRGEANIR